VHANLPRSVSSLGLSLLGAHGGCNLVAVQNRGCAVLGEATVRERLGAGVLAAVGAGLAVGTAEGLGGVFGLVVDATREWGEAE
jgi:hypothetical protein